MTEESEHAKRDIKNHVSKTIHAMNDLIKTKWFFVFICFVWWRDPVLSCEALLVIYGLSYLLAYYHLVPAGALQCIVFINLAYKPFEEPSDMGYLSLLDTTIKMKGSFIREWKGEERRKVLVENAYYCWLNTVECQLTGRQWL